MGEQTSWVRKKSMIKPQQNKAQQYRARMLRNIQLLPVPGLVFYSMAEQDFSQWEKTLHMLSPLSLGGT